MAGTVNTGAGGAAPPMPNMMGMLLTLMIVVVLIMFNGPIGEYMNYVMQVLDFGYEWPVITLVITGVLMTTLSTVVRALTTDMVEQQRNQKEMSAFSSELRKARIENNLYKIKKLTEQQQQMTAKSMASTSAMMKTMPLTMLIVIPMFAWVRYFVDHLTVPFVHVPWAVVNLTDSMVLPMWMLVYTLISIPFGQLVNRIIRYIRFKARLKELEEGAIEVI